MSVNKITERVALRYFGKVNASISHELKNVLAILNENAGLLQDFVAMEEQGMPLDAERIHRLSETMQCQIARGDAILKRMNRFAHSADNDCEVVELNDMVRLVTELFERTAITRGVKVENRVNSSTVTLETHPFMLETLLGELLDQLSKIVTDTIIITPEESSRGACIRITGLGDISESIMDHLSANEMMSIVNGLLANMTLNQEHGEILITFNSVADA
jgi:C4-dicarboxylate-specific signal transduction histidine kinase